MLVVDWRFRCLFAIDLWLFLWFVFAGCFLYAVWFSLFVLCCLFCVVCSTLVLVVVCLLWLVGCWLLAAFGTMADV